MAELAEKYFDTFAAAIDERLDKDSDPGAAAAWRSAVIQEWTKRLWRDVHEVWTTWLNHIREMTAGTVFRSHHAMSHWRSGVLKAHQKLMASTLWSIASRHSIPKAEVREILSALDLNRLPRVAVRVVAERVEKSPITGAGQDEGTTPLQWLAAPRLQQRDIAVQEAVERLGRQPGWAEAQLQLIQADKDRVRSIGSGSSTPWEVTLSYYTSVAEAWLTLVADSQCAKGYYTILPGDRIILVTDGVTEAESVAGDPYGNERLEIYAAQGMAAEQIFASVHTFSENRPLRDDCTVMELNYLGEIFGMDSVWPGKTLLTPPPSNAERLSSGRC